MARAALPAARVIELEAFLRGFALPLVQGGALAVGEPVSEEALAEFAPLLGGLSEALEAIDDTRRDVAAALVVDPPPLLFGEEELKLVAALYDALVLVHPDVDGWGARRGRRALASLAQRLARVEPATSLRELLSRHTLLHGLPGVIRRDVRVSWWTGRAEFRGQAPPPRLLAMPTLRRVRKDKSEVPLAEIVAGTDGQDAIASLLAASPVTDLLSLGERRWPSFTWTTAFPVLRHAALVRAVLYRWLDRLPPPTEPIVAEEAPALLRGPAAAAASWFLLLGKAVPAELARLVTAFLVHLNTLIALTETGLSDLDGPSPLLAALLRSSASPRTPAIETTPLSGLLLFLCAPDAAGRVDPTLGAPPGLADDPALARRFRVHRAQVRAFAGERRIEELQNRLAAVLQPR